MQSIYTERYIDRIVNFIVDNLGYDDKERIKYCVEKHLEYGTFQYAIDENQRIIAVARWNVSDDGKTLVIIDFAVDKLFRGKHIGCDFIREGVRRFKDAEYVEFWRGLKSDYRHKRLKIDKILKKNII